MFRKNHRRIHKKVGLFNDYDIIEYNFDLANETEIENKDLTKNQMEYREKRGSLRSEIETTEREMKKILLI